MSTNSVLCHASTCLRIGLRFRCIRSTPTEMPSIRENDFECLASTGVNTPSMPRRRIGRAIRNLFTRFAIRYFGAPTPGHP
jgi:hypothetical protein